MYSKVSCPIMAHPPPEEIHKVMETISRYVRVSLYYKSDNTYEFKLLDWAQVEIMSF